MTKHTQHTPTPWEVYNGTDIFTRLNAPNGKGIISSNNDGWQIAECVEGLTSMNNGDITILDFSEQKANAQHIVHCVNNHDALVKELETAINILDSLWNRGKLSQVEALAINNMEKAIKLAKEQ